MSVEALSISCVSLRDLLVSSAGAVGVGNTTVGVSGVAARTSTGAASVSRVGAGVSGVAAGVSGGATGVGGGSASVSGGAIGVSGAATGVGRVAAGVSSGAIGVSLGASALELTVLEDNDFEQLLKFLNLVTRHTSSVAITSKQRFKAALDQRKQDNEERKEPPIER